MTEKKSKYKTNAADPPRMLFMLESILKDRGMTKVAAAAKIGISKTAILNLTSDPQAVRMDTLAKICKGLEIDPRELFEYAE